MYFILTIYNYVKAYIDANIMYLHIDEYKDKTIYQYTYNYNFHKKVQLYIKTHNMQNFVFVDDKLNKKWNLYINLNEIILDDYSLINTIAKYRHKIFTHEKHY